MILYSLDFETTGVNTAEDVPIEFGGILYSTGQRKCLDNLGVLLKTDRQITPHITSLTGCHPAAVARFGYEPSEILPLVIDTMSQADAVIGYNCRRFDQKILAAWAQRQGLSVPELTWIDLFYDLPWQVPVGKLSHTLADHGHLNPFPHSAFFDAAAVILLSTKYDEKLLLERARSKQVVLQSQQTKGENDLVKQAPFKFRWNPREKIWWKPAKEQDVQEIINSAPFKIVETGWTAEELDN